MLEKTLLTVFPKLGSAAITIKAMNTSNRGSTKLT